MSGGPGLPTAVLEPRRRLSAAWLVPLLALMAAGWLGWRAWTERGLIITVHLDDGRGLREGDEIRYRGITVGEIRRVRLSGGLGGVRVTGSLRHQAQDLATAGSRFWVVRPQVSLERVSGLETLMGPRFLAVLPGGGPPQRVFVGLAEPPAVERIEPGDLEVIVQASQRQGLQTAAPVLYRGVPVGTILSVGLTSDGGAVEGRLHIEKPYTNLIRPETRFWPVGGVEASLGLGGLTLEMSSLQSLLSGGVALATPPDAGPVVRTGHRFTLADAPEKAWLGWQPMTVIGNAMLPPGAPIPSPLRATIGWREGWVFRSRRTNRGWVLPVDGGLLGPADLLVPDPEAREGSVTLEVAGAAVDLPPEPTWTDGRLARIDAQVEARPWPMERSRRPEGPEDALVVADPAAPPFPLAESRLTPAGPATWFVDPAIALGPEWHGGAVVARADGQLVGLLLVDTDGKATVGLVE